MAGLFGDQQKPTGGLLGGAQPSQNPTWGDYALALLAGGTRGAAGLALQSHMNNRRQAAQQPYQDELEAAFAPRSEISGFTPPQVGASGMAFAPRATEQNGQLTRQLQRDPGLTGAPQAQTRQVQPTLADLAPALFKASRAGVDVSPYLDMFKGMQSEQAANRPSLYNTSKGIVSIGRDGSDPSLVYETPEKAMKAPAGFEWADESMTALRPLKGGPYDPEYIGRTAGVRRDAVVSRPTPARPRAAPAAGSSGLPPGYVPR